MLPAQPVDATPSSTLIPQCLCGRTIYLPVPSQDLAMAAFLLVQSQLAILAFVFNAGRIQH
jgi:hypothetical protein